jgi:hypothetical protein
MTTLKRKPAPKKPQWMRPVGIKFDVQFANPSRKVTLDDLDRAAAAAAAAFRASLEGRTPPYDIERFEVTRDYSYLQGRHTFDAM